MRAPILVAALLLPVVAHAEDEPRARRWQLGAEASYVVLGPEERQTGGLMPSVAARHIWPLSERWEAALGAQFGVFGLGDETRWIGILGGPHAAVTVRPAKPIAVTLEADADFGRIPICNPWGLCLRFVGFYPAAKLTLAWRPNAAFSFGVTGGARVVQSLAWNGASGQVGASATVAW